MEDENNYLDEYLTLKNEIWKQRNMQLIIRFFTTWIEYNWK